MRLRTFGGLRLESSEAGSDSAPRPRPLALLAILAVAGDRGLSRDRVLGVLWPETEEERARQSLSQAIYSLKRDLGLDVAASRDLLRLDPSRITSDVGEFRAAVAAKRWTEAAALYTGAFLDGFYLADAPEFERWAESERASLATLGIRAVEIAAKAADEAGHREEAVEHWHRLTQLDPANSRIAAAYMHALAASGDQAAAIAHGKAFAELLRREFDAEPDAGFERLLTRLRQADVATSQPGIPAAPRPPKPAFAGPPDASSAAEARRRSRPLRLSDIEAAAPLPAATPRRRTVLVAGIALAAALVVLLGLRLVMSRRASDRPILAVGRIRDIAAPDSVVIGAVLSEMLATSLSRLSDMQVVANSRMLELTPQGADTSRTALTVAARRAGATEILEGELMPLGNHELRLELRRVDIASGLVRAGYRVVGNERLALFDSATALVAADFRLSAPSTSLGDVTTRSPVAYRLYEEGLRALYQSGPFAANPLFQSAVREDSTFAMATYYAWLSARASGDPNEDRLGNRAIALAWRAPPRERLVILTHVGSERSDLRALAAAETLATNYPRDPEALALAAGAIPDLSRSVPLLERAIALDSAVSSSSNAPCRLCDALSRLVMKYEWADSGDAAFRTIRRWQRLRPKDPSPWSVMADWYTSAGRRADADAALRRYDALGGARANVHLSELIEDLRFDDFDAVNRACREGLSSPENEAFEQYRWYCVIALRWQGRYREAVPLAREGRVPGSGVARRGVAIDRYLAATLDMESGRALDAANEFLTIYGPALDLGALNPAEAAADSAHWSEGLRARYLTWVLTLSATASVTGGDTSRARSLVDSIQRVGSRSAYARDPVLHHFVRGLLLSRAGRHDVAARELRAAMVSPTFGYTRINYELGRSLLALGRPAEGIPVLQAALRGGIEGSGLYITRTELHELLALLFDANQQRDSAAAHYVVVARAWASADPFLASRYQAARAYLARH